jgi:hypothetical protein
MPEGCLEMGTLELSDVVDADPKRSVGRYGQNGSDVPCKGERRAIEPFGMI